MEQHAEQLKRTHVARMSLRAADLAVVLWGSFLSACFASLVFFGIFDPLDVVATSPHLDDWGAMTAYGIGFLFFWLCGAIAAALSVFLIRTSRRDQRRREAARALREDDAQRASDKTAEL